MIPTKEKKTDERVRSRAMRNKIPETKAKILAVEFLDFLYMAQATTQIIPEIKKPRRNLFRERNKKKVEKKRN